MTIVRLTVLTEAQHNRADSIVIDLSMPVLISVRIFLLHLCDCEVLMMQLPRSRMPCIGIEQWLSSRM